MSTTTNVQSFLPYVFRPTYTYSTSNGFSTLFNIRNIDTISAATLLISQIRIGDVQNNVYIGNSSGNAGSNITLCNSYSTTALGALSAAGQSNVSNTESFGYASGQNIHNVSNSTFIGTLAGSNSSNVFNSLLIGANAGQISSNVSNTIVMGKSSLSNVSPASNVIVIGVNTASSSPNGGSNIYIGNSNTIGLTGAGNIIIGHQVAPPPYTVGGVVSNVPTNMSNKLFIGSGSNVLIAGDFVSGCVSIGSTNTTPNSLNGPFYSPILPAGAQIQLDVAKYVRIGYGLGIGVDPGTYAMDVNGQLHASDGSGGDLLFGPPVYGSSNGALTLKSTAVGGTMALNVEGQTQSRGYYTLQSGVSGVVSGATLTISNVLKNNGLLTITIYSGSLFYSESLIVTNYSTGASLVTEPVYSSGITRSAMAGTTPNLAFTVSPATYFYNITCFPVG